MRENDASIPLLPRRRVHGSPLGDMRSGRRGDGAELVGLREYRRGDDPRRIDQRASARASHARGSDVLLVREFYAEEAARVLVLVDRSPSMALFPAGLPWLRKPQAVAEAVGLLARSARDAAAPVGCLAPDDCGAVRCWPPTHRPRVEDWAVAGGGAPAGSFSAAFGAAAAIPRLGKGTFVFAVSDFVDPPGEQDWWRLLGRGFDPVPVVVSDPLWERSFPAAVGGVPLPVAAADGSGARLARVSRREARALRARHEERFASLLRRLRALTLEPVCIDAAGPAAVHAAFARWAAARSGRLG